MDENGAAVPGLGFAGPGPDPGTFPHTGAVAGSMSAEAGHVLVNGDSPS